MVVAIVAVLAATLWFIFAPMVGRVRIEQRVRSDLHQLVVALHVYANENDGVMPPDLLPGRLPKTVPIAYQGFDPKAMSQYAPGSSFASGAYWYAFGIIFDAIQNSHKTMYRFDPSVDPVVKCQFYQRLVGKMRIVLPRYGTGAPRGSTYAQTYKNFSCLGGRLDGSIGWMPCLKPYNIEFGEYLAFRGVPK